MHNLLPAENTQFLTSSLYSTHQAQVVQTVQLPRWNMFGFQRKWIDFGGFCFWLSSTTLDIFFQLVKIVNECERESQSCPTLCDCMNYTVHGVLQARILEWVKVKCSVVTDSATPRTVACQAPPPMGFSRQECWSGLPFPSPGDLPHPGIEPGSPAL